MNPGLALQTAMRGALLNQAGLLQLLGGAHVYEEMPRGGVASHVSFEAIETRDWSTADAKAHEHFISLSIRTNSRSRKLAQDIVEAVEAALDNAALALTGHRLVNLRLTFWSVTREKNGENFGASLRFRAATEPL